MEGRAFGDADSGISQAPECSVRTDREASQPPPEQLYGEDERGIAWKQVQADLAVIRSKDYAPSHRSVLSPLTLVDLLPAAHTTLHSVCAPWSRKDAVSNIEQGWTICIADDPAKLPDATVLQTSVLNAARPQQKFGQIVFPYTIESGPRSFEEADRMRRNIHGICERIPSINTLDDTATLRLSEYVFQQTFGVSNSYDVVEPMTDRLTIKADGVEVSFRFLDPRSNGMVSEVRYLLPWTSLRPEDIPLSPVMDLIGAFKEFPPHAKFTNDSMHATWRLACYILRLLDLRVQPTPNVATYCKMLLSTFMDPVYRQTRGFDLYGLKQRKDTWDITSRCMPKIRMIRVPLDKAAVDRCVETLLTVFYNSGDWIQAWECLARKVDAEKECSGRSVAWADSCTTSKERLAHIRRCKHCESSTVCSKLIFGACPICLTELGHGQAQIAALGEVSDRYRLGEDEYRTLPTTVTDDKRQAIIAKLRGLEQERNKVLAQPQGRPEKYVPTRSYVPSFHQCEQCEDMNLLCDGREPKCRNCNEFGMEKCSYPLKRKLDEQIYPVNRLKAGTTGAAQNGTATDQPQAGTTGAAQIGTTTDQPQAGTTGAAEFGTATDQPQGGSKPIRPTKSKASTVEKPILLMEVKRLEAHFKAASTEEVKRRTYASEEERKEAQATHKSVLDELWHQFHDQLQFTDDGYLDVYAQKHRTFLTTEPRETKYPFGMSIDAQRPVVSIAEKVHIHHPRNVSLTSEYLNRLKYIFHAQLIGLIAEFCRSPSAERRAQLVLAMDHIYLIRRQLPFKKADRLTLNPDDPIIDEVQTQAESYTATAANCERIPMAWELTAPGNTLTRYQQTRAKHPTHDNFPEKDRVIRILKELEEKYPDRPRIHRINGVPYPYHPGNAPLLWTWGDLAKQYAHHKQTAERLCNGYYTRSYTIANLFLTHCIEIMESGFCTDFGWLLIYGCPWRLHPFKVSLGHRVHGLDMDDGWQGSSNGLADFDGEKCNITFEAWPWNSMRGFHDHYLNDMVRELKEVIPLDNSPYWNKLQAVPELPVLDQWRDKSHRLDASKARTRAKQAASKRGGVPPNGASWGPATGGVGGSGNSSESAPPYANLVNVDNSSYASSLLQCLFHVPDLRRLLETPTETLPFQIWRTGGEGRRIAASPGDQFLAKDRKVYDAFNEIAVNLARGGTTVPDGVVTTFMRAIFQLAPSEFTPGREHDPGVLFDNLCSVFNRASDESYSAPLIRLEDGTLPPPTLRPQELRQIEHGQVQRGSPIEPLASQKNLEWLAHRSIGHASRLTATFPKSGHADHDPTKTWTVEELIETSWAHTTTDQGDDASTGLQTVGAICPFNPDHPRKRGSSMKITRTPKILVVRVERLTASAIAQGQNLEEAERHGEFVKNPLQLNEMLDLKRWVDHKLPSETLEEMSTDRILTRYRLDGVVQYRNRHYVSYARVPDRAKNLRWAFFNDLDQAVVWDHPMAAQAGGNVGAVLLFYTQLSADEVLRLQTTESGAAPIRKPGEEDARMTDTGALEHLSKDDGSGTSEQSGVDEELEDDDDEGFDIDEDLYFEEELRKALEEESDDGAGEDEHLDDEGAQILGDEATASGPDEASRPSQKGLHAKSSAIERVDNLFVALAELAKAVDLGEPVSSDQLRQLRTEVARSADDLRRMERCLKIAVNATDEATERRLVELSKENEQLKQRIEDSQSTQQQREQVILDAYEELEAQNDQLKQHIEDLQNGCQTMDLQSEHQMIPPQLTPLQIAHDGIVNLSNEDVDGGMDTLSWREIQDLNQGVVWLRNRISSMLLQQVKNPSPTAPSTRKERRSRIPRLQRSSTPQVPSTPRKATPKASTRVAPIEFSSAGKPPLIERRAVRKRTADEHDEEARVSRASTSRSALSPTPTGGRRAVHFRQSGGR